MLGPENLEGLVTLASFGRVHRGNHEEAARELRVRLHLAQALKRTRVTGAGCGSRSDPDRVRGQRPSEPSRPLEPSAVLGGRARERLERADGARVIATQHADPPELEQQAALLDRIGDHLVERGRRLLVPGVLTSERGKAARQTVGELRAGPQLDGACQRGLAGFEVHRADRPHVGDGDEAARLRRRIACGVGCLVEGAREHARIVTEGEQVREEREGREVLRVELERLAVRLKRTFEVVGDFGRAPNANPQRRSRHAPQPFGELLVRDGDGGVSVARRVRRRDAQAGDELIVTEAFRGGVQRGHGGRGVAGAPPQLARTNPRFRRVHRGGEQHRHTGRGGRLDIFERQGDELRLPLHRVRLQLGVVGATTDLFEDDSRHEPCAAFERHRRVEQVRGTGDVACLGAQPRDLGQKQPLPRRVVGEARACFERLHPKRGVVLLGRDQLELEPRRRQARLLFDRLLVAGARLVGVLGDHLLIERELPQRARRLGWRLREIHHALQQPEQLGVLVATLPEQPHHRFDGLAELGIAVEGAQVRSRRLGVVASLLLEDPALVKQDRALRSVLLQRLLGAELGEDYIDGFAGKVNGHPSREAANARGPEQAHGGR